LRALDHLDVTILLTSAVPFVRPRVVKVYAAFLSAEISLTSDSRYVAKLVKCILG
jgi:hypothetical protein